jgi:tetratricopeptide (TPR) repeat protein
VLAVVAGLCAAWPVRAHVQSVDAAKRIAAPQSLSLPETKLMADAADGTLDDHSLLTGALLASGLTDETELARYQHRFDQLTEVLSAELAEISDPEARALKVHEFLHRRVLGNYRTDATDVRGALAGSEYNCVSASVLYVALAKATQISARAVQLPEHVCCQVTLPDRTLLIETTSRNPAAAPPGLTSKGRRAAISPRPLNDAMLLATVYYNRGVTSFDTGNLAAAIEFNQLACLLDPVCRPARENLLAAINNRVVQLAQAESRTEALELIDHGLAIDPQYRPFLVNRAWLLQSK